MPKLPSKKVGIVACSGEEMAEGTVTRLAALKVLEELRPQETVTICLPLFLAGGEGERAFARFYPTIAVDGCELRCAARATEKYSGKPAASFVVTELVTAAGIERTHGRRRLNEAGRQAVDLMAESISTKVDELLDKKWSRRQGAFVEDRPPVIALQQPIAMQQPAAASCACGSGIPITSLTIDGQETALVALPLIFEQFKEAGKAPTAETGSELLAQVKLYNFVPAEAENVYLTILQQEYIIFCGEQELVS